MVLPEAVRPYLLYYLSGLLLFISILWTLQGKNMGDFTIPELERKGVEIKNPAKVKAMIQDFISGGREKLQVVADFDRTLSRYKFEGKLVPTCHGVLTRSELTSDDYKKKCTELFNKYYPIEMDKNMTPEEKLPHMVKWWTAAHEMILSNKFTRSQMEAMAAKSNVKLRDGAPEFFLSLQKSQVPLLIFSAGVGDVIEGVLRQLSLFYGNMKIVSNFLDFNEEGECIGFKGDIIHIYNKNEGAIHDSDYFKTLDARKNVLLLGDSVGDLTMAKGVEDGRILKIGFLNDRIDELREIYKNSYDIVLVEDESMDIANAILKAIS